MTDNATLIQISEEQAERFREGFEQLAEKGLPLRLTETALEVPQGWSIVLSDDAQQLTVYDGFNHRRGFVSAYVFNPRHSRAYCRFVVDMDRTPGRYWIVDCVTGERVVERFDSIGRYSEIAESMMSELKEFWPEASDPMACWPEPV